MKFKEYKESLKFRKYNNFKILIRFIEYKIKDFTIDLLINFNLIKSNSKQIIDLGSFSDNRFINFFVHSLKDNFIFVYKKDQNTKKLLKRIGIINFFKYTQPKNKYEKGKKIKILINKKPREENEVLIDTDYFKYFYNSQNKDFENNLIMPYYMYPRIYNSYYKDIKPQEKPNFNLRIFFSGSIVKDGYKNFNWSYENEKFPNRIKIIENIIKEFKNEIFFIKTKNDLKKIFQSKKKIFFCLHDKMIKKTSYTLNFKENLYLLGNSCFNLNCPGVVMPLCHHMIEGMKVGSIPITNCDKLVHPNLSNQNSLQYSNIDQLIEKFHEALIMPQEEIILMRKNVLDYYNLNLSPENFKTKFLQMISDKGQKLICCDDHRSVGNIVKK